MFSANR